MDDHLKHLPLLAAILLLSPCALAQFSNSTPETARDTRARGYWTDPSTNLMWAATDSVKEFGWHKAARYCRNLRVGTFSDWRLPTVGEMQSLVNLAAYESGHFRSTDIIHWNGRLHVNGGLQLLHGRHWAALVAPHAKNPAKYPYFDFRTGRTAQGFEDLLEGDRLSALCVRETGHN